MERSVLIVEDDDFFRELIANYLTTNGFTVFTAGNALDAIKMVSKVDPDAIVLDIDLGGQLTGIDVANRVKPTENGIALVFLTSLSDLRFSNAKASSSFPKAAYLNKHLLDNPGTIIRALETALTDKDVSSFRHDKLADRPLGSLTSTQIQVLQLVAAGKTNQQISEIRGTTIEATEAMIVRVWKSLGIDTNEVQNSRVLAARLYLQFSNFHGLTDL